MIVVLDASPIIFLGKIGRLTLIEKLVGEKLHLVESVRDEVLVPFADSRATSLEAFLNQCTVHRLKRRMVGQGALSRADLESLRLAHRLKADVILCDDRVLRRVAESEGLRPLGTLGVLLRSVDAGLWSAVEARTALDDLIRDHGFRIGVDVYQAALARLGG